MLKARIVFSSFMELQVPWALESKLSQTHTTPPHMCTHHTLHHTLAHMHTHHTPHTPQGSDKLHVAPES